MIELIPFLGTDDFRPHLMKPFSRGDYSYATDGAVLVRVARRPSIAETSGRPNLATLKWPPADNLRPLGSIEYAEAPPCGECDGHGAEHDCPDCTHPCVRCNGTGKGATSVRIGNQYFDAKYIRKITALPSLMVRIPDNDEKPMYFTFDGGDGLLQSLRERFEPCGRELKCEP